MEIHVSGMSTLQCAVNILILVKGTLTGFTLLYILVITLLRNTCLRFIRGTIYEIHLALEAG